MRSMVNLSPWSCQVCEPYECVMCAVYCMSAHLCRWKAATEARGKVELHRHRDRNHTRLMEMGSVRTMWLWVLWFVSEVSWADVSVLNDLLRSVCWWVCFHTCRTGSLVDTLHIIYMNLHICVFHIDSAPDCSKWMHLCWIAFFFFKCCSFSQTKWLGKKYQYNNPWDILKAT